MTQRILLAAAISLALAGCQAAGHNADVNVTPPSTQHVERILATHGMASPATTQAASLREQLKTILNRHADTGAFVAARVIDPSSGEELFAQDADRPVTPASNMKITTTATAFEMFGPDHLLETNLYVAGNDLYLVGSGDPSTGDQPIAEKLKVEPLAFMDKWADELKAMGKSHLTGKLYYVDNAFEAQQVHPDWSNGDKVEWYGAPIGGLNLNDNCVDITVEPAAKLGDSAVVTIFPETTSGLTIVNNTKTADPSTTKPSTEPDVSRAVESNTYTITGMVSKKETLQSKPVTDPGAFFAEALKTRLAKKGVTIDGAIEHSEGTNVDKSHALTPATTKFSVMLSRLLKNSQNLFADATAKLVGLRFANGPHRLVTGVVVQPTVDVPPRGSWKLGERGIREFLEAHNIDDSKFVFADGSGLSSKNKVTARLISDIFAAMMKDPHFDVWKNCLTIAGTDGTTRKRLTDHPNRVFCKTGFISGVRSLSGYVVTDSGKTLVFSFIYNGITPRGSEATKPYEECQDDALRVLIAQ